MHRDDQARFEKKESSFIKKDEREEKRGVLKSEEGSGIKSGKEKKDLLG